jgi:hypothetical protein
MAKTIIKTVGEGGAHAHKLILTARKTDYDGRHKHIYFVNDRILMTDLSGEHQHKFDPSTNTVGPELERHKHVVTVRTQDGPIQFETQDGQPHYHELQVNTTTLSGVHEHVLPIMDEEYVSLVPGDLIEEVMDAAKSVKQFQSLNLKRSEDPMEMDFALVKKLNQTQYKEILSKAVEKIIIKRMTRLGEGLRIESLILSRERFTDVGQATIFVLDQGLNIKSSQVLPEQGIFTFQVMSRDAFEESTLQRIRITEGVEAVIGFMAEKEEPQNDNVVASGTIDEMTDVEQDEGEQQMSLKDKFKKAMSHYDVENFKEELNKSFALRYDVIQKNDEKRLMTGPVLIPDNIDLQDDIISSPEIEKAAHGYMVKLAFKDDPDFLKSLGFGVVDKAGETGFQHMDFSRKMAVVETFIAPVEFDMNGRNIKKGTWVMTMKVFDDEVWALVKTGKITGFSIGGRAKSRPVTGKE